MPNKSALTPEERALVREQLDAFVKTAGSQSEAAKQIGVTQQAISKALRGEAGFDVVRKLARALDTSLESLLRREGPRTPSAPMPARLIGEELIDLAGLSQQELLEQLWTLARRQLRLVYMGSVEATENSVKLADVALELVHVLERSSRESPQR